MRVERIGDATLYLCDCMEVLPTLPKVDAVITDPPYGIKYASNRGGKFKGVDIANDDSLQLRDAVLELIGDTPSVIFGSWRMRRPAGTRQVLVWDKGDHVGMGDLSLPWRPNTEEIYVLGSGFSGHRGSSVIRVSAPSPNFTPDAQRYHPTEKPVALIATLLAKAPGGTVLDPFMGSGTTGVACVQLGRKFIGIEIEPKYFDIACKRIAEAYAQPALIPHEQPKQEQQEIGL